MARNLSTTARPKASRKRGADDTAHSSSKRIKPAVGRPRGRPKGRPNGTSTVQTTVSFSNTAPTTRLDIYVFGEGSAGELGLGPKNAVDVQRPRLNAKLDAEKVGIVNIAAGGMHAVALTHDNRVLTWGVNDNHALGRETSWEGGQLRDIDDVDVDVQDDNSASEESDDVELNPRESTPTAIAGSKFPPGTRIVGTAAGDSATFVLTEEGLVYGWGTFLSNQGDPGFSLKSANEVIEKQSEPMLVPGLERIIQISAGNNFCLALDVNGKVYSWGRSEQNQLGRRIIIDRHYSALNKKASITDLHNNVGLIPGLVALPPRKKITSIHAGSDHAFAIDSNGDTWAWGLNNFGQTGIKTGSGKGGSTIIIPQKVPSLAGKNMQMIQGGSHHSIGITQTGQCLVWGRMDGAQMGLDISTLDADNVIFERGKPRILLEPTVLPIPGCVYAAAGSDHNLLITAEGKAYSWGFNANYQCGQEPGSDDIPVATLIDNPSVCDKKFCWAGAGGQYSMLASPHGHVDNGDRPAMNGVSMTL